MKNVIIIMALGMGFVYTYAVSRASALSEIGCGTRVEGYCQGCSTSGNPTDTGCRCGKNLAGPSCDCVNNGGAYQGSSLTNCTQGYWTWNAEPPAKKLSLGDPIPCGTVSTCRWAIGATTACATYDSETGRCLIGGVACNWVVTGTFTGSPVNDDGDCP